jgi:putative transposase
MTEYRRIFEENRFVFITVVTYNRNPILIENIELLGQAFKHVQKYNKYEIFGIVILPDHFHMLIKPDKINEYPQIISSIKYYFSKNINNRKKERNLTGKQD